MNKIKLHKERSALVVKSNTLIRDARYKLTELEQKLIIYFISKIKKDDTELEWVEINLRDYCNMAKIEYCYANLKNLKDTIKGLADKSFWIPLEDDSEYEADLFRWIERARLCKAKDRIKVKLNQDIAPYVLELKEEFTKYEFINVLFLNSKYSVRLYELLKSYLYCSYWEIPLKELRDTINCIRYENNYSEFNRNVLKKSIEEINKYTDLIVEYAPIRYGRLVGAIEFTIREKDSNETIKKHIEQKKRLYTFDVIQEEYMEKKKRLNGSENE